MKVFRWWKDIPVSDARVFSIVAPQEIAEDHPDFSEVVRMVQREKYFEWELISMQRAIVTSSRKQQLFDRALQAATALTQTTIDDSQNGKSLCQDFRAAMKIAS